MKSSAILLMAGSGTRSLLPINKTLYKINDIPLFMYSLNKLYEVSFDEYPNSVARRGSEDSASYAKPNRYAIGCGGLVFAPLGCGFFRFVG